MNWVWDLFWMDFLEQKQSSISHVQKSSFTAHWSCYKWKSQLQKQRKTSKNTVEGVLLWSIHIKKLLTKCPVSSGFCLYKINLVSLDTVTVCRTFSLQIDCGHASCYSYSLKVSHWARKVHCKLLHLDSKYWCSKTHKRPKSN